VGVGRSAGSRPGGGRSDNLQKKADELHAQSLQNAVETIEKLQSSLKDFAAKHQSEIQNDPAFRQQFLQMCGPLGVDPLVSRKSFWSKTLGVAVGDYYYELSVKVAEICFATRTQNGGLTSVKEVLSILNKNQQRKARGKDNLYNQGDVEIAVQKLSKLGGGFRILEIGKKPMIVSVPTELDQDHTEVMSVANSGSGVTVDDVCSQLGWNQERAERALHLLLQEGMAWQDDFHGITFYWFPSVWKEAMAMNQV
jgi:ESCRT-II complex subunit VPS22